MLISYLAVLIVFYKKTHSDTLNTQINYNAKSLLVNFTKFEIIVTAII